MEDITIIKLSKLIEELQQTLKEEGNIDCYNTINKRKGERKNEII